MLNMKPSIVFCISLFVLLGGMNTCFAQIVNVESARMQSDTTGWMGNAGVSFSLNQSVKQIVDIELDNHIQYKNKKNTDLWLLLTSYGFQKGGTQNFVNNSIVHFRYNHKLNPWLRWEAFTQLQNNLITQIRSRFLVGTGPRFKIFSTKLFRLYAATLLMYERERENTTPQIMHNDIRNSSYISFTITPQNGIEIISTAYYQPLVNKISDWRVLNQATVKVKFGKHFRFSLLWNYLHDRFPAGSAPETTYTLKSGVDYEF